MTIVGCFQALGQVVEIRAPRSLASLLAYVLGDLNTLEEAERRVEIRRDLLGRWSRRIDGVTAPIEGCPAAGFYEAIGALDDLAAAQAASSVAVLHASCIDVGGTAIAFAGLSGAGKSTLAAALATAGHGFIADEVAAVDGDGHVAPYHRPVGLRAGGAAAMDRHRHPGRTVRLHLPDPDERPRAAQSGWTSWRFGIPLPPKMSLLILAPSTKRWRSSDSRT